VNGAVYDATRRNAEDQPIRHRGGEPTHPHSDKAQTTSPRSIFSWNITAVNPEHYDKTPDKTPRIENHLGRKRLQDHL
jgi:hypothetical protein